MSKLIELIRKLGQQAQQPLGFGALASRVESSPSMALIGEAPASRLSEFLDSIEGDAVSAVILDANDADSITECERKEDVVWGVGPGRITNDDVESLADNGCDFFIIDIETAPAAIASQADTATIVELEEAPDRETALALRGLGASGSLIRPQANLSEIAYKDLVEIGRVGASVGGVLILECPSVVTTAGLASLRDAGVDAIVVSLSDSARVAELAAKIRELPPRKKGGRAAETRFQALAPSGSD